MWPAEAFGPCSQSFCFSPLFVWQKHPLKEWKQIICWPLNIPKKKYFAHHEIWVVHPCSRAKKCIFRNCTYFCYHQAALYFLSSLLVSGWNCRRTICVKIESVQESNSHTFFFFFFRFLLLSLSVCNIRKNVFTIYKKYRNYALTKKKFGNNGLGVEFTDTFETSFCTGNLRSFFGVFKCKKYQSTLHFQSSYLGLVNQH